MIEKIIVSLVVRAAHCIPFLSVPFPLGAGAVRLSFWIRRISFVAFSVVPSPSASHAALARLTLMLLPNLVSCVPFVPHSPLCTSTHLLLSVFIFASLRFVLLRHAVDSRSNESFFFFAWKCIKNRCNTVAEPKYEYALLRSLFFVDFSGLFMSSFETSERNRFTALDAPTPAHENSFNRFSITISERKRPESESKITKRTRSRE